MNDKGPTRQTIAQEKGSPNESVTKKSSSTFFDLSKEIGVSEQQTIENKSKGGFD